MALKIRWPVVGRKSGLLRIVVAEASAPRDGRFVERLGSYNPMVPKDHPERLTLDGERAKYWMSKGAKPTERVQKMMAGIGLMEAPEIREQPKKSAPARSARNVRPKLQKRLPQQQKPQQQKLPPRKGTC